MTDNLATLYGVETKRLNEQVKRNTEDFIFQLTKDECLRSQIATLNEGRGQHLNHLSDYGCWNQKDHAADWVLLEENMGEHFCIDESMLHHDLYTFLINKDGHGKNETLVGAVKGTTVKEVSKKC